MGIADKEEEMFGFLVWGCFFVVVVCLFVCLFVLFCFVLFCFGFLLFYFIESNHVCNP